MLNLIQRIYSQLQDWLGEIFFVMRFFHLGDLVRPRKLRMMIRGVYKLMKPINKDDVSSYLLGQDVIDVKTDKFLITREYSRPSQLASLFLQLFDYVKIKYMDIMIWRKHELGFAVINGGYKINMGNDFLYTIKDRPLNTKHPIVRKLKGFLEKNGFAYLGEADVPVRNLTFRKDNMFLIIEG